MSQNTKSGLIAYFAGNSVTANLLILFFFGIGIFSALHLTVQNLPEFKTRYVMVTVEYPGATPQEVEADIVRHLEEGIVGLTGVERVIGTSVEGAGQVDVEIASFAVADKVVDDVQNAVNAIEAFPPINAEAPEVELEIINLEVLTLAVSSDSASEHELRLVAENLRDELLRLPSVSLVSLEGTRDRQIIIELGQEDLRRNNLTLNEVARKIRMSSLNQSLGELRTEAGELVLNSLNKRQFAQEFNDIPLIARTDGSIVKLGDLAKVREGFADDSILSTVNGIPAILVRVEASAKQSIIDIANQVQQQVENFDRPPNIQISSWNDQASPVYERFSQVLYNGIIGTILVLICLCLVFDLRVAFWIALGIPVSFAGSLFFFGPANLTLNMGTVFAFFLLLGLVVDDAIVVGEGIEAERQSGREPLDASIRGAKTMFAPVTIGVITTLLGLLPLAFITESGYQIVRVIPYVAALVMLVSLIEVFLILPAHLAHPRTWGAPPLSTIQKAVSTKLEKLRDEIVVPAAAWSVRNIWLPIVMAFVIFVVSMLLLKNDVVRVVVLDRDLNAPNNVQVDIYMPQGTPFDHTHSVAEIYAQGAELINDKFEGEAIKDISVMVGSHASPLILRGLSLSHDSNLASVRLHLNNQLVRTATAREIEQVWREIVGDISGIERIEFRTSRRKFPPSISYGLFHSDNRLLNSATRELKSAIQSLGAVQDAADSLTLGKQQFEIHMTPAGLAAGLTPFIIGEQLRASYHGINVQRIQRGHEEVIVSVRFPEDDRTSLKDLTERRIRVGQRYVSLSEVANIEERREPSKLFRIDGRRVNFVEANVDMAVSTPIRVRRTIQSDILPALMAKYPELEIQEEGGARNEKALLNQLALLFPIVLAIMYALIAGFLRSYWKPFVAVAGIPIAFAGSVFGHLMLGWDFTIMSLFGVLGVGGVIMNDSLVLFDRYNQIRKEKNVPAIAAVTAAIRHRFRAVFLTSVTTILGLTPMIYSQSDVLLNFIPLVVSIIGGLVASTLFVLFVLPALVMVVDGRRD